MAFNPLDGYIASNISATTAAFNLAGGMYGVDATATFGGGNIVLQKLAGDGTTWVIALTAITTASFVTVYLPAGSYRLAITTATGCYVVISHIPLTKGQ
jgi:microcystin-dependent protein